MLYIIINNHIGMLVFAELVEWKTKMTKNALLDKDTCNVIVRLQIKSNQLNQHIDTI